MVSQERLFRFTFPALGGENELQLFAPDRAKADYLAAAAISIIRGIESKFSRYLPTSVVSMINAAAGGEPLAVDPETAALLRFAHECYLQSDGSFDITSGVLRRAWNFRSERIPAAAEVDALLEFVGWEKVELEDRTVRLSKAGMELDFGGFGKEYAADCAAKALRERGVSAGFVNLGGDIAVVGPRPDGLPWSIGIKHPRCAAYTIATLEIGRGAVATSGDYERYISYRGKVYSHILNAKTGWPVEDSFQSVTVVSDTCIVAGVSATIAMLKGVREGQDYLRDLGCGGLVVDDQGRIFQIFGQAGGALRPS